VVIKTAWTAQQTTLLRGQFCEKIAAGKSLNKLEVEAFVRLGDNAAIFEGRSWLDIKNKVWNETKRRTAMM
jgi:hypothetical protein